MLTALLTHSSKQVHDIRPRIRGGAPRTIDHLDMARRTRPTGERRQARPQKSS